MELTSGIPHDLHERIDADWQRRLDSGTVHYDPSRALSFLCDDLTFRHIPGRDTRPQPTIARERLGVLSAHTACPFDDVDELTDRQVFPFEHKSRGYHVIANRYPVTHRHYLIVRSPLADARVLPQCLFGPDEIEDLLLFAGALGSDFRSSFNSNPGRDLSHSGASINHWHSHFLPLRGGPLEIPIADTTAPRDTVRVERVAELRVPHRVYKSGDTGRLAQRIWEDFRAILDLDCAFNLEIFASRSGLGAALFARRPVDAVEIPGVGTFTSRFGGFELTGNVVVYDRNVFDWMRERPERAAEMAWDRLQRGTRDIWSA